MDRLMALQAFARVVELGAFTKAGDSLQLSKTTVSDLVQGLENHLGVRLLQRTTRAGFHPMSVSALHSAAVSLEMKKSANALTFAGRARPEAVTKYRPPSGKRQSVKTGSSCLSTKYCVATNSGSSVIASPARTVGSNASTLVPRNAPVGVTVHSSPRGWVKRQTSRLVLLV